MHDIALHDYCMIGVDVFHAAILSVLRDSSDEIILQQASAIGAHTQSFE